MAFVLRCSHLNRALYRFEKLVRGFDSWLKVYIGFSLTMLMI